MAIVISLYGEVGSDDYYNKSSIFIKWNDGRYKEVYLFLRNSDTLRQKNNSKIEFYSKNRNGTYTLQEISSEKDETYGELVKLESEKNWYSGNDFKGYYYHTWISNGWWTLFSYVY
ncbi:MAG: hypothetical protein ACK5HR_00305 [Mycoplasmatales bacterium]